MINTLSVITICFNNLVELIETCTSIGQQTTLPDEHLIIDGSSNEEILNWLTTSEQPAYRRWIHERDNGISDAFNKGIRHAKGTLTHILNSGDKYFASSAIESVKETFDNDPSLMWTHSQYVQHRGDVDVISGSPFEKNKLWKGMRTVAHPTMFIKKKLYEKHGVYKTDLKIAMDYDLLVRIRDEEFAFIPKPLVYFAPGGASNLHFNKGLREVRQSYQEHIGFSYKLNLWQLRQLSLNYFMQTAVGKTWFRMKNRKKITSK